MIRVLTVALAVALVPAAMAAGGDGRALERLMKADANGDGAVTRDEFSAFRRSQFARLDRDDDGFLTQAEIDRVARFLPAEFDAGQMIPRFDANKDGRVSVDEFANGPAPVFARVDANNDAVVTQAEANDAAAKLAAMKDR